MILETENKPVFAAMGKTFAAKDSLKASGMKWESIVAGRWAGYSMPANVPAGVEIVEVPALDAADITAYLDMTIGEHAPKKFAAAIDAYIRGRELMNDAKAGFLDANYTMLVGSELPKMRNKIAEGETYWREDQ